MRQKTTSVLFGLSCQELALLNPSVPVVPVVPTSDDAATSRSIKAAVVGRLVFTKEELSDDALLQSVLLRDGVSVELEEQGSVVVRVRGLRGIDEHDKVCRALMQRRALLERKMSAVCSDPDVVRSHGSRLPNVHIVTLLAHVRVVPVPRGLRARPRTRLMQWRFVPFFAALEQGGRLARTLLHAARRIFATGRLLVWFGVPGVSRFQLKKLESAEVSIESEYAQLLATLDGTFSPMTGAANADKTTWIMRRTPTGANVLKGDGAPTGFFALSNRVDVEALAACVWNCLDRLRSAWCDMPALPVGANQRVVFRLFANEPRVDPAGATLQANAVVVLTAVCSLQSEERAAAFLLLLRQCTRVEVVDVAQSGAPDAVLQAIIDAAHTHDTLRCVLVDSATFHSSTMRMGACCMSSAPDDAVDDAAAVRLERMFAVAAFPW